MVAPRLSFRDGFPFESTAQAIDDWVKYPGEGLLFVTGQPEAARGLPGISPPGWPRAFHDRFTIKTVAKSFLSPGIRSQKVVD